MKDMKIKKYLDENLSGVYVSRRLHEQILTEATEGKRKVKKASFALVLALVLTMAVVSALAITISHWVHASLDEAVEQQTDTGFLTRWNEEDKHSFAELLLKHALINEADVNSLVTQWEYPDDALRFAAELAYGDMYSWNLEQSAWLNKLLADTGILERPVQLLPDEDEITQEQAETLAEQEIIRQHPQFKDVISSYYHIVRYSDVDDGNGPFWQIEYYQSPSDADSAIVVASVYSKGAIIHVGLQSADAAKDADIGAAATPIETDNAEVHTAAVSAADSETEIIYPVALSMAGENDLPQVDAVSIATDLLLQQSDVIRPLADSHDRYSFPLLEVDNREIEWIASFVALQQAGATGNAWIISFFPKGIPALAASVMVASPSGEVIQSVFGYLSDATAKWEKQLGSEFFWSIQEKYVFDVLYSLPKAYNQRVLPNKDEIRQDQALEKAIAAVRERYGIGEQTLMADCKVEYGFFISDAANPSDRCWYIGFRYYNETDGTYRLCYEVRIDAADGAVISVDDYAGGLG